MKADPFEFVGKQILVILASDAFQQIFTLGNPIVGQDGVWVVHGQVAGEVPGVGFWLRVISFTAPSGKLAPVTDEQAGATYLVRWEQIFSARIAPSEFTHLGRVGFQPPLP